MPDCVLCTSHAVPGRRFLLALAALRCLQVAQSATCRRRRHCRHRSVMWCGLVFHRGTRRWHAGVPPCPPPPPRGSPSTCAGRDGRVRLETPRVCSNDLILFAQGRCKHHAHQVSMLPMHRNKQRENDHQNIAVHCRTLHDVADALLAERATRLGEGAGPQRKIWQRNRAQRRVSRTGRAP